MPFKQNEITHVQMNIRMDIDLPKELLDSLIKPTLENITKMFQMRINDNEFNKKKIFEIPSGYQQTTIDYISPTGNYLDLFEHVRG